MTNVETSRMSVPGAKKGLKQMHEKIGEHLGLPAQPEEEGKGATPKTKRARSLPPLHVGRYQDRMESAFGRGMMKVETSCIQSL